MTLVINSIEIEDSLTINGVDVTSDVQSVGEKVANAGGVASFAADLASSKPTAGVVDRVFISTDSGIISIDDGSTWNNILPAYSGDVASSVGGTTLTLATVNSNTGTFGSTNTVPVITVNGKGLITSVTTANLTKSSVGLGNVANVDTTNASNISSGTLANARLSTNLSQLGGLTPTAGDYFQFNGSAIVNVTAATVKTSLSLTKGDVGLGNVANVDTTNATNISSGTLANARLTTNLSQLGGITFATNDFMQYNGTTLVNVSPSTVKTALSLTKSDVGLSNVANVDTTNASNITTGTLPLSVIPAGALERLVVVADQTARFALTTATVQNGDTVKQNDTGVMYFVQDDTNLGNSLGYELYRAGAATSVPYSGITSLPSNISQLGSATFSTNDIAYYNGTVVTNISPTSYKALLSLTKSDVGLSNVVNSLQVINAGNGVSFASGNTASRPVAGTNGRLYASTDSGIFLDNGTSWVVQQTAITGDISISANSTTATLATVNSNVGTFNNVTVNAKGLVTAASNVSYLTGNQSITLSGDVSGTGTTAITVTLPTINLNVGTFNNVVVNGKGQVTAASNVSYLTANQTITASGDVTGSGTTGIALTLATVNSNVGTFGSTSAVPVITVNGKGLVTAVSTAALTSSSVGLGNVTNSLQVINAGGAVSHASGTNASKPAAGTVGRHYYSTDQGITYYDTGAVWSAKLPAYTGDVTSALGGTSLTLATVNSNIGTFNNVTVNGKGLVTAASNVDYLNDAGTNGVVVRTSLNTTTARTITGTTNTISVTNGDGVSANPTITIANNPVIPGTASMTIPIGTTAQRDTPTSGQMRYNTTLGIAEISDNGVYRPFGKVAQIITGNIPQTTGTTILPYDTTAPTNTEGFEIFSTTITPTYDNSNIVVIFNVYAECSLSINTIVMSLYNNTTSISVTAARPGIANASSCLGITKNFVSATTAPITLSARVGPSAASTVYVNRGNTETMGLLTTSYIIMEII